ncbi:MAG TPA: aldo/keto reductase [Gemmatimonadaceae bacterium]|jgi:aryl-alcohol dehydrogenase-like predicted oxidoreductase
MTGQPGGLSRRDALKIGVGVGLAVTLDRIDLFAASSRLAPLIEKPIPSTGEKIPVIGMGTARYFDAITPELREVIKRFPELGGKVIDLSPSYSNAESVVGDIIAELKNRPSYFLATKVTSPGNDRDSGQRQLEESMRRLHTDKIDLMQIHNLIGVEQRLPLIREWKQAGRLRYVGITTSFARQYEAFEKLMHEQTLDFIQVDYSIDARAVEERILPLAIDRGMAVLVNSPFRRGRTLERVQRKPLPSWTAELEVTTWAELLLKYLASHPAVTCVIPGTERVQFLVDNMVATHGRLPDTAMRKRIEQYYDGTTA